MPFHTIIFPASQIGTRERWTQMKNISVTEYLNYEGEKFSKSNGVGVFGDNARETGIPVEVSTPSLCLGIPTAFSAVKFRLCAHIIGQISAGACSSPGLGVSRLKQSQLLSG